MAEDCVGNDSSSSNNNNNNNNNMFRKWLMNEVF
jgi:hypothetical protein